MTKTGEYRQAAIIFVLMSFVFFWPLFKGKILSQADAIYFFPPWSSVKPADFTAPSNTVLNDQTREFLTFFQVAKESFGRREFPLWNPYIMAGTPLLADSQSALLFPLNWPFYTLPLFLGFTVSGLLKMLVASMGTYAFTRRLSVSHFSAILSGTAYTFSVFNVFWLNHPHTNATIFFPWLLLLAEHISQTPSPSAIGLLGLTVGVQLLGGHVEIAFQIAFAVTLFFLFRLSDQRKDRKGLWLRLKSFVGGYTLGFFLAAVLMIPFLEFLSRSATWQVRSGKNPFFIPPMGLLSLFSPDLFVKVQWPFDISAYHSMSLYVGVCPLILGGMAFALGSRKITLFFGGLSLFGMVVAFGIPPFFPLLTSLPLFKQAPNYYMVLFPVLGLSVLGGIGMDWVTSGKGDPNRQKKIGQFLVGASLMIFFLTAGIIWLVAETSFVSPILNGLGGLSAPALGSLLRQVGKSFARSLLFSGFAFALVAGAFWTQRLRTIWKILAVGLIFVDLFVAGSGWNPAIPGRWANPPLPESVQFLHQDKDLFRVAGLDPVMPPNLGTLVGLQDIRGYDVPVDERYHVFFEKVLRGRGAGWIYDFPRLESGTIPFLSLLNVKYLLSLDPLPTPLMLVYDKEVKVYANPESFSRAFLVHRVETVRDGPEALARLLALGSELRQIAVLEGPAGSFPDASVAEKEGGTGDRVRILAYSPRQVEIEVDASSPGLLVLGDTYFPGWKAEVDGEKVPIFRTDYLLRGVAVDRGSHRVRFFYRPDSFYIGLGLTIVSGAVILWLLKKRRKKARAGSSS